MANALFPKFKESALGLALGSGTRPTGTLKAVLIDVDTYGLAVTAATNATPIVVTTATHGLSNGMLVSIIGALGNTAANGLFKVASVTATTFALTDPTTGANVAGNGTWTSGGRVVLLGLHQFQSSLTGVVGTATAIGTPAYTNGLLTGGNVTFTAVSGASVESIITFLDTGTTTTSPLVSYMDTSVTGLPVTPNGGDITVTWNASGIFQL